MNLPCISWRGEFQGCSSSLTPLMVQALDICDGVIEHMMGKLSNLTASSHANGAAITPLWSREDLQFATGSTCSILLEICEVHALERIPGLVERFLEAVRGSPGDYHLMTAAAQALEAASASQQRIPSISVATLQVRSRIGFSQILQKIPLAVVKMNLSDHAVQEVLSKVQKNLSHPAQPLRRATLRLLAALPQPAEPGPGSAAGDGGPRSEVMPLLLQIESAPCSLDAGRKSAVTISRLGNLLEYRRVPEGLVEGLIEALIGLLHIRCVDHACTFSDSLNSPH